MPDAPNNPAASSNGDSPLSASPAAARRRGLHGSPSTPNRFVAWFRGWTRRNLGREQVSAFLKTLLWVGPLTALIWIYAERQQVDKRPGVTRPVEVVLNDPNKVVRILKPADKNIVLELVGPKAALDRFTEQGNTMSGNSPLQILLEGKELEGIQRLRTIRVGQDKRFIEAGITVMGAVPEEIEVLVDPIVEVDARVISDDPTVQATFDPPTVKVRGPRSLVRPAALEKDKAELYVRAALKERVPQMGATEATELPGVRLSPDREDLKDPNVSIVPAAVTARVEKERKVEYTIPTVRIVATATPAILNDYRIDFPDHPFPPLISNVEVIGPEEQVRTLRPSTNTTEQRPLPKASVEITELPTGPNGEIMAKLKYDLPPNVQLKPSALTEVRVVLTPR